MEKELETITAGDVGVLTLEPELKRVRVLRTTLQGVIVDTEYNKQARELRHLVEYTDHNGRAQSRWFNESQLVEVKEDGQA